VARGVRWLANAAWLAAVAGCGSGSPDVDSPATDPDAATMERAETPADADRLSALRADSLPEGFAFANEPMVFEFPRDHGPHPRFRHEWWYITGHLDAASGEPFGFELTFFRFALKPPSISEAPAASAGSHASDWRTHQIYMAHFAVSDLDRREFHVFERFQRDALGLAGAQADPFRVSLDDWSLGVPADAAANSREWRLVAAEKGYSLHLTLDPASPLMLNGNAGLSQKANTPGAASYYYSIPRMAARGQLTRDGKTLDVQGTVWLDREWGSGSLGGDQQGWDWFALQLDDGSALMFYALRKKNGQRDANSAGTWLERDGSVRSLASNDVQIEVKDHWDSPRGGRYPARWQLRVPSLQIDVDIEPRLADQELATSTRYWEGASLVRGQREGRPITGKAYVELVGYASRPR
jgi:predicted secreted hydrolase